MIEFQIQTPRGWLEAAKVSEALAQEFGDGSSGVELREPVVNERYRGLDPSVIVAIVSALGSGLGVFLGGLLRIAQQTSAQRVVLKKSGDEVLMDVPVDISKQRLQELIEELRSLEAEKVQVELE